LNNSFDDVENENDIYEEKEWIWEKHLEKIST
jgi:hypothetical protein